MYSQMNIVRCLQALFLIAALPIGAAYPCPYDGPAENLNETRFQVETYLIDMTVVFPQDPNEGYVEGTCSIECISLINGLDHIELDFYTDDAADVQAVTVDGTTASFTFDGDVISIALPGQLAAGAQVAIIVTYRVEGEDHFKFVPKPPKTVLFGFNAMVEASRWFPCLHDPRDKALYEFRITTANTMLAACNGTLMSNVDHGDGTRTMTWIEHNPMATYLATVNVSEYTTFGHDWAGIPVVYYVRPESQADAAIDFQNDDAILDFYDSSFGSYPFEKMGLAQVRLAGAMENQDMISYGLITGDQIHEDTFAHEISHMYWGNSITLTGCEDVWLNEGFASYCEALWEEHFYGETAYNAVMEDFRQRYFQEDAGHRFSIYDPEDVWSNTTYRKGAWVLHMLRRVVGEAVFWQILPEYYDRYKFTHATTPQFQAVCEELHGSDLDWFFQEWIYLAGYPEFQVYPVFQNGNQYVFVEQIQINAPVFRMPAVVRLDDGEGGVSDHAMMLESGVDVVQIASAKEPATVILDPDNSILSKTTYGTTLPNTRCILEMPSDHILAGDTVWCRVHVDNFTVQPLDGYPLFVILDVYGQLFFAPSFSDFDSYLDAYPSWPLGRTTVNVLPSFTWPAGAGTAGGIVWYAGLTVPDMTALFGELDLLTFGWE
ncbi:M1 family metallopeptidase [bacterium]|nr:M1 family metallopeptidase [candidate division CSSED10-310 bacterium]